MATDRSGTITTGGVAQTLALGDGTRRGLSIQNVSSGDLWVNVYGTASATAGRKIAAGDEYVWSMQQGSGSIPVNAVSIFGATTGQAFAAEEW